MWHDLDRNADACYAKAYNDLPSHVVVHSFYVVLKAVCFNPSKLELVTVGRNQMVHVGSTLSLPTGIVCTNKFWSM